ncbi:MAG: replication-relaxation family protein, partial [Dehalococcoidia bacterium]
GVHVQDARALRHELERRGWVDWIVPGAPGLEPRRLCFVREEAAEALAERIGTEEEGVRDLSFRTRDVLDRVVRVEITAGVNRFFADLASSLQGTGLDLVDARSLPTRTRGSAPWELPAVEGYGCLRSGDRWAPFFVAWDRAGAPDAHRRARVAAWTRAADVAERAVGKRIAPILVVGAGQRELSQWECSLRRRVEPDRSLHALLAGAGDVLRLGPMAPVWLCAGSSDHAGLLELLAWGEEPAVRPVRLAGEAEPPRIDRSRQPLREWAPRAATGQVHASARERVAAVALATDAEEKRLLEWIARHPLLAGEELSELLEVPGEAIERRLDWLTRCGAVLASDCSPIGPTAGKPRRYVLTDLGLRLLAARDRVPPARYVRSAGLTVVESGTEAKVQCRVLRHPAHAIGVNRTVARLASNARAAGWRLTQWRNEAESARHFRVRDRTRWIRPDASGVLRCATGSRAFLLEYDRGTLDGGDYRAKLAGYDAYFASSTWEEDFETQPALLFVCTDDRAERRVARAISVHAPALPLLLTTEWRFERVGGESMGLLRAIWARPGDRERRIEPFLTEAGR